METILWACMFYTELSSFERRGISHWLSTRGLDNIVLGDEFILLPRRHRAAGNGLPAANFIFKRFSDG